ncbi:hypothetical protein TcasGA2_TC015798 [Tribolium castaneum]|uniref:Uncharacterized protein n=1 Tax=Tribolium castaneum TaxID=7070 RepID=D2A409_TRICA|nr:hypothetical protein TcasGA2_TC015798 [Tribolium castaneum]
MSLASDQRPNTVIPYMIDTGSVRVPQLIVARLQVEKRVRFGVSDPESRLLARWTVTVRIAEFLT